MATIGDFTRYCHAIDNIYSLRWNSELFFKAMKSGLGLRALFVKNDYSLGFKLGCMLMSVSISRYLQRCVNAYMVAKQKVKSYLNSFRGQLAKVGNLQVKTDYADNWTLHSVSGADHQRFTEMWQEPYPNETTLRDSCEVLSARS